VYKHIVTSVPDSGLPASRARLAGVLRASRDVVSVEIAARVLDVDRRRAAEILSRWLRQGWLRRVGRGLYAPVPLDLAASEQVVADPWVLVPALFGTCYIGGWTAAHHWEFTEQLFKDTLVFTTRRVVKPRVTAQGTTFVLRRTEGARMFGLTTLWRGTTKVQISDPARTMIDLLDIPTVGGGMDHVADCLVACMKNAKADRNRLVEYAERLGNGAVFKRLGFLAEVVLRDAALAESCRARLTKGYARLDPALPPATLVTSWRLWIPAHWKARARDR
jgi:predicted transcriptional regulator of viral defense system